MGLGAQQAPWAQVGQAIALRSSPASPGWLFLPATPDLTILRSMPPGPTWPGWGFGGGGYWLGSLAGSPARVGQVIALRSSPTLPRESLPPASPDLPGLRGADPVWPPLLLPHSVPLHATSSLWGSSCLLGHQSPHQRPAGALFVVRR